MWIGTLPGYTPEDMDASEQSHLKEELFTTFNYVPVLLSPKRDYFCYEGYCKHVLCPLLHSIPPTTEDQILSHDVEFGDEEVR